MVVLSSVAVKEIIEQEVYQFISRESEYNIGTTSPYHYPATGVAVTATLDGGYLAAQFQLEQPREYITTGRQTADLIEKAAPRKIVRSVINGAWAGNRGLAGRVLHLAVVHLWRKLDQMRS